MCKRDSRLLVIRPSVIGPSIREPFRFYEARCSAPITTVFTAFALCTSGSMVCSSRLPNPESQSIVDEIPVDIVVNRIIVHAAAGSSGCVHAVAGPRCQHALGVIWSQAMSIRRLPWTPSREWRNVDWKSEDVHPILRQFVIVGSNFLFEDDKTRELTQSLSGQDKATADALKKNFPLFLQSPDALPHAQDRLEAIRNQAQYVFKKQGLPQWLSHVLLSSASDETSLLKAENWKIWFSIAATVTTLFLGLWIQSRRTDIMAWCQRLSRDFSGLISGAIHASLHLLKGFTLACVPKPHHIEFRWPLL